MYLNMIHDIVPELTLIRVLIIPRALGVSKPSRV